MWGRVNGLSRRNTNTYKTNQESLKVNMGDAIVLHVYLEVLFSITNFLNLVFGKCGADQNTELDPHPPDPTPHTPQHPIA